MARTLRVVVPVALARSSIVITVEKVCELGGEVLHIPRTFPQFPPPYYATFWLDPFGFMLEAVCHHDSE
jgi:hypothetical protein